MDLITFAPVKYKGAVVGFVGSIAHHADMCGAVPGGVAGVLNEIYLEGLRFPMVKLYRRGKENQEIMGILTNNIRVPQKTLGDIRAQVSASFVGIQRTKALYNKYSPATVQHCVDLLLDYSEKRIRAGLQKIPDGLYTGVDFVDDDGVSDTPIRVQVNLRKEGDHALIDFDGTDAQVAGNVNCPLATTYAATYYALIAVVDPHVPPNSGCYRPFEIRAEPGLVVNPTLPHAVGSRTNTSQKISEALLKALANVLPDHVMAGSHGQVTTCAFSGFHPETHQRFVYVDIQGGGAGARWCKDGRDGQDSHLARFMNTPIEAVELEYPIRIERYEFVPDTGGAGKYRGALALCRQVRSLVEPMSFARYGDRQVFAPAGLYGGREGSKGIFILNPDRPDAVQLKSKGVTQLKQNDLVSLQLPGAGGYGDPRERDRQAILSDVRDGKVSPTQARTDYGLVIDPLTMTIDESAARQLGDRKIAERKT